MVVTMSGTPTSHGRGHGRNVGTVLQGPLFIVRPIPGKGLGCCAARSIEQGERILAERPLFMQGPGHATLKEAVLALSPSERVDFFNLSQNEAKWGMEKHVTGIYATNAIPSHSFLRGYSAIFPTAARLNHACDANAVYKFNATLGALTVHAVHPISAGSEVTVCYGFPDGVVVREERQRHLAETFGFTCRCGRCSSTGVAVRDSDRRLSAIGHPRAALSELRALGTMRQILQRDAADVLGELEHKHGLMQQESGPGGSYFYALEAYLHYFVEFCDAAASRLLSILRRAGAPIRSPSPVAAMIEVAVDAPAGGQASTERLSVPLTMLQAKAAAYAQASKRWALVAVDVVRDVFGEDSPTLSCWAESLSSGCWEVEGGSFDFYQRFLDAGLSAPLPAHSDAAKHLDASGAAAGGLDGAGGRGSRLSGTNHQHAKSSARPRGHALPLCTSFVHCRP